MFLESGQSIGQEAIQGSAENRLQNNKVIPSTQDEKIHARATRAAQAFKRSEAELVEALIAVDGSRVYRRLGYPSLFRYTNECLGLSEAVAYCAIAVARKSARVPALRAAVSSGKLGLSKAKKILTVFDSQASAEKQREWIEKAMTLSSRALERAVAGECPTLAISERVVYKSARRAELTLGLSEEILLEFRQAQNLVSTRKARAVNLEETLKEVLEAYLARKDPERRAKRILTKIIAKKRT